MTIEPPTRVAAIDCGTNTIRLLVAETASRGDRPRLVDIHREQRIVRLGEGVDASGHLAPQAIDRVWQALADYTATIRAAGVLTVRMAATSALRDADNADDFIAMVRSTLGQEPEILSGLQEAQLGFHGTVSDLAPGPDVLVVDIGGGSTELVAGPVGPVSVGRVGHGPVGHGSVRPDAGGITAARSMDIGAVRLTERVLRGDPPDAAQLTAARDWIDALVEQALVGFDLRKVGRVVGVAGTALTVAAGALRHPIFDPAALHLRSVPVPELHRTTELLVRATRAHRAMLGYVHPGRVDVIGAGALILSGITEQLRRRTGVEELIVSEHDLLDGLALSMAADQARA